MKTYKILSRCLVASIALLCAIVTPSHAQKTKAALTTEINTNWPDNSVGVITPALLRSTVIDIVNSYYDLSGGTSLSCAAHLWVAALPTLSSITCTQPAFSDLSGSIASSQIPFPTATTIGGIESIASLAHNWVAYIDTSGVPHQTQPAFSDISSTLPNSQLANMNAHTLKGNNTGSAVAPIDLTDTQATAELNPCVGDTGSGGTKGLVPAPPAGSAAAGWLLGAGCSWAAPAVTLANLKLVTPMDSPYNAKCDNITDDSTAIKAWVAAGANNAFVGWGVTGVTCRFQGLITINVNNVEWYLNGMTFKVLDSISGTTNGFVCGPSTELGGPTSNLTIHDGIFDGNRANQTNTQGAGALFFCPSISNLYLDHTTFQNSRADNLFIGGNSSTGAGRSSLVHLNAIKSINAYRNDVTFDGVDQGRAVGGFLNSANNSNNNGPQCGIDLEPDDGNSTNTNIVLLGLSASANAAGTSFSGTGGTGICVFGSTANSSNIKIIAPTGNSNLNYVVDSTNGMGPANVTLIMSGGTGNGHGPYNNANIIDWMPTNVQKGAANGCGTGFACVGVPN